MSEFLELLETLKAEDASFHRLFGDAGTSIRGVRRDTPTYRRALAEAAELVSGVYAGRVPTYRLQEAMSTSDFPLLFGDILDRQLLGLYEEWPTAWPRYAKRGTVRDFRTVSRFATDGAEAILPEVPQGAEYTEAAISEARYQYAVKKYGRKVPFLWETLVNDDLDGLRSTPERIAKAARMSEERFATELFVDTTGPDATFFTVGAPNNNKLTLGAASALSPDSLQSAFTLLWSQKDADGNPVFSGQMRLIVPPALAVTARNILNAAQLFIAPGATTGQQPITTNWMASEIAELVVNPWLPIIDTTSGSTAWYLFADPGVGRPPIEVGFLRGNETPALFVKTPNATRIGGGVIAAEDGDFETDGVSYKVRHVFGGTLMDFRGAVASKGAA